MFDQRPLAVTSAIIGPYGFHHSGEITDPVGCLWELSAAYPTVRENASI